MVPDGFRQIQVLHPHTKTPVQILRPLPIQDNPWGKLDCLKDSPLYSLIPVVTGEAMSHALHGDTLPLFKSLGPEPKYKLKKGESWKCAQRLTCVLANHMCYPQPKLPLCYSAPFEEGQVWAANVVIGAWCANYYVVVVEGAEFSLSRRA